MKEGKAKKANVIYQILFILYMIVLSYLLFFSKAYRRTEITEEYHYNLVLFREIKRFYHYRDIVGIRMLIVNVAGNIVAFMPLGFLLPPLFESLQRIRRTVPVVCFVSLIAELIQLVYKVGTFDVDDIFLNTIGGMTGYLIWRAAFLIFHRADAAGHR